jgi:hypothetical protein
LQQIYTMWVITQETLTIDYKGFYNIHALKVCQKPNEGSTSLNVYNATLPKIEKYLCYYQYVMSLVGYYIFTTIPLIRVI